MDYPLKYLTLSRQWFSVLFVIVCLYLWWKVCCSSVLWKC